MRRAGYEDSEFPAWWYSPARTEAKATQLTQGDEARTQQTEVTERLEEVPPRKGPPIARFPQDL